MVSFQITVIICAIILFVFVGMIIAYNATKPNKKWPPSIGVCPDYWNILTSDDKKTITCIPDSKLFTNTNGNTAIEPIDTTTYNIRTPKGRAAIHDWTNTNHINWDGISDFVPTTVQ